MISYGKQYIDQSDIDAVVEILKGDWLTQGPGVKTFEDDLGNYFGANYTCAVANGTAALHLTGIALGWQPGDIVITSPITFLATANSIVYSGATPDFADIDPVTYTIDPIKVEEKIKVCLFNSKKIKAIIGVDYAGHPCNWKALRELADRYDLQLVNDNCHALGASYFGDKQYAVKYADVVTQSYHPVKHITTGEGGAVLTSDSTINEKVRRLRAHGMTKDSDQLENNDGPWYYEMHQVGYNYRITDFQCALGISQLKKLNKFIKKRNELALLYNNAFKNNAIFSIPHISNKVNHAFHLYPLLIDFKNININKKKFFKLMGENGIGLQVHYIPIHLQPFYKKNFNYKKGDYPIAEQYYEKALSLPLYPSLSEEEQDFIIKFIKEFT